MARRTHSLTHSPSHSFTRSHAPNLNRSWAQKLARELGRSVGRSVGRPSVSSPPLLSLLFRRSRRVINERMNRGSQTGAPSERATERATDRKSGFQGSAKVGRGRREMTGSLVSLLICLPACLPEGGQPDMQASSPSSCNEFLSQVNYLAEEAPVANAAGMAGWLAAGLTRR